MKIETTELWFENKSIQYDIVIMFTILLLLICLLKSEENTIFFLTKFGRMFGDYCCVNL